MCCGRVPGASVLPDVSAAVNFRFRRLVNPPAQPELCDHQTNQSACIVRLPVHTIRKCEGVAAFAALLGVIVILQVLVGAYTSGFGGHQMSRPIW